MFVFCLIISKGCRNLSGAASNLWCKHAGFSSKLKLYHDDVFKFLFRIRNYLPKFL
jgi:hypothetical protein